MQLDPILDPNLVNGLSLKDKMCTTNPLYNLVMVLKFSTLSGNLLWEGISQPLGVTLISIPSQGGILLCSPGLCRRALQAQAVHC